MSIGRPVPPERALGQRAFARAAGTEAGECALKEAAGYALSGGTPR